ncbi:putative membrane protein YphA (DoxX/SURF4 family) [Silvibacterium bohemicum]|uniref:Putative membrane protein YphA (DoxX/SURF4 family) n=1 Tax=Silvibacterium bohemicum TaxID=1577686 RepID=A0A841K1E1_9BACT|nr:hypothetical protein [Silvibacterium bohemicum]MBB6145769.1 putative membrane protein YphA (DoxX/SURF4 family) [Silvibacterium bohemicum]
MGLGLLIGILTPLAGGAAACGYLAMAASDFLSDGMSDDWKLYAFLNLSIMSIALVLLGPGAVSLDAHLFGRREIIIPEGRRAPRQ